MEEKIIVVDVIHQNYAPGDGIPPHWACQYFKNGFAEYELFETKDEAYEYAFKHGYTPF